MQPLLIVAAMFIGQARTGINVSANMPYATSRMFVDQMLTVSSNQAWLKDPLVKDSAGKPLRAAVDDAGYPIEPASASFYLAHAPQGAYTFRWTGSCSVKFTNAQRVKAGTPSDDGSGGHSLPVTISGTTGAVVLHVSSIDPANPPRGFRLITPGYDPANPPLLQADFVRRLRPYECLRVMDLLGTIDDPLVNFADRAKPTDWQGGPRIAWEYIVQIVNIIKPKRVWLNVPYHASPDCQAKMADFFLDGLDPSIAIDLEFSNEIWNSAYEESKANAADALAAGVTPEAHHVMAVVAMGKIWRQEATARGVDPKRIRVVYAGQATVPSRVQAGLNVLRAHGIVPSDVIDALSCAAYTQVPRASYTDTLTVDATFAILDDFLATKLQPGLAAHGKLATDNNLGFVIYEWGESLIDFLPGVTANVHDTFSAAQADPRMGAHLARLGAAIDGAGAQLANYFGSVAEPSSQYGYWGLLESNELSGGVKYDAILRRVLPPGDVTLDRAVDFADYLLVAAHQGLSGAWLEDGDLNGDGKVDPGDVAAWAASNPAVSDPQRAVVQGSFPSIAILQHR